MGGERLDLGQGLLQAAAPGVAGGIVGVEGNGAQEPRIEVDRVDRKPGRFEVAAHLHGTLDAHGGGGVEGVLDAHLTAPRRESPNACGCP